MMSNLGAGFKQATGTGMQGLKDLYAASEAAAPYSLAAGVGSLALNKYFNRDKPEPPKTHPGMIRPYTYERTQRPEAYDMGAPMYAGEPGSSAEKNYFNESYTELTPYRAPGPEYAAEGGIMGYAVGGPVEQMAAMNAVGANTAYPMAGINTSLYANPMMQRPEAVNVLAPSSDAGVGAYSGEPKFAGGGETFTAIPDGYTTVGGYNYSYDPNTMQFTQTGTPTLKANSLKGFMRKAVGMLTGATGPKLDTGAATVGGVAPPAMPAQATPAQPAAPAYTPPSIPAYQPPEQQLGLGSFYSMMDQQLAGPQAFGGSGGQRFYGGGTVQAVAQPQQEGDYKYDYDPQTMQFTQTATPTVKPSVTGLIGKVLTPAFAQMTGQTMGSTPAFAQMTNQPITGAKVSGGIAPPAMPAQPAAAQPVYTPPPVPAYQTPEQQLGLESFYPMMERRLAALGAAQGYAAGGDVYNLGGYSDGGRLLKGPGDGVSDSIPAVIGQRQPARLADGEFVVPARIVSELGNGSTEAGARKLYAMMDRVQKARSKTVGKNKVAANTRSEKYLPA
jgi:hypothetical protein